MLGQGSEETKAACPVGPPIDSRGRVVATGLVLHGLFDRSVSTAAEERSDLIDDASPSLESPLFRPLTEIAFVAMHMPGLLFPVASCMCTCSSQDRDDA